MFEVVESNGDENQARKMSSYMRDIFKFLGISKPKLNAIITPFFKKIPRSTKLDWQFIDLCWDKDYREAQYIAIAYIKRNKRLLDIEDLDKLQKLIVIKSWWETVDSIDEFIGVITLNNPELKETMLRWSISDNIWIRRVAIDFQQKYKDKTDVVLLEKIIVNNLGSRDYFISKSIGWSLRDYSKVNPDWVLKFIEKYKSKLDRLSVKEACKYLCKNA